MAPAGWASWTRQGWLLGIMSHGSYESGHVSTSWTRLDVHHGQVKHAGFHPESYGEHSRVLSGFFHMVNLQRR